MPADRHTGASTTAASRLEGAPYQACQMAKRHKVVEPDHQGSSERIARREDRQVSKILRPCTRNGANLRITLVRYSFRTSRTKMDMRATVKFNELLLKIEGGSRSGYTRLAHSATQVH